jgi:flagellin
MALGDLNGDGVVDIVAPQTGNTTATDGTEVGILLANRTSTSAEGDVKVNTAEKAQDLLAIIDTAIDNINEERNNLAAVHSRLQSAYAANLLLIESYSDAYSEAVDADIAIETAELTRNQVQQQAQIAVLAQANVQLQTALRLIEG